MNKNLEELANSYHHSKLSLADEEPTLLELKNNLVRMKAKPPTIDLVRDIRKTYLEINELEEIVSHRKKELLDLGNDLLLLLKELGFKPEQQLKFPLTNQSIFYVWYTGDDELCCNGPLSQL